MKYLSAEDILIIHAKIIESTGGANGVRDVNLFSSIIERPKTNLFKDNKFKTVFDKAAVYLESISRYHVFIDGNKRTAFASSAYFLFINGYSLEADKNESLNFVLNVATGLNDLKMSSDWLKKYSKKI